MRWLTLLMIAVVSALAVALVASPAAPQPAPNQVSEFMRAKLPHTQKILEGLATEDFEMILKHSQNVALMSQAAMWQVLQTPEYNQQSLEFRRTADAVANAARNKNLDEATVHYLSMISKCVQCHKYVRNARMAQWQPVRSEPAEGFAQRLR